jgi:regulator of nucleoside diphosphate kinase
MKEIHISTHDHKRLSKLVDERSLPNGKVPENLLKLQQELSRATILPAEAMPPRTVGLNTAITIKDMLSGELEEWTLTLPEHADAEQRRLSILAPIGTAVLGFHEGDEINWSTPGGTRVIMLQTVEPGKFTPKNIFSTLYA